jgi:hypothetical protein
MPLGVAFVDKLIFNGSGGIIAISKNECSLVSVVGGKEVSFTLDKGAIIDPKSGASLVCNVKNVTKSQVVVFPQATLNEVGPFGKQIEQKKMEKVSIEAGAEAKISYQLPKELTAQSYQIRLDAFDNNGGKISQSFFANFGINNFGVSIQNILLDKEAYAKGDLAKVVSSIGVYRQLVEKEKAPIRLNVTATISNGNESVCGSASEVTDSDKIQRMELSVPINIDCAQPSVTIKVMDEKGNELGTEKFSVGGLDGKASRGNGIAGGVGGGMISNSALVIIIITIVALVVILIFMLGKKSRKTRIGMFLILFAGGLALTDLQASADTINLPGFPVVGTTYSLNKSVYAPGEKITVGVSGTAWPSPFMCSTAWFGVVASVPTGNVPTSIPKYVIFWPFGMCGGATLSSAKSWTAPIKPGNYDATFVFGYYNFYWIRTIPFKVVATDGMCGTANGQTLNTKPSTPAQLCSIGTSTPVIGEETWTWSCLRVTPTGKDTNCSASRSVTPPTPCTETVTYNCVSKVVSEEDVKAMCFGKAGENVYPGADCLKTTKCDDSIKTVEEPDMTKCNNGSGCPSSVIHCPKGINTNAGGYREVTP